MAQGLILPILLGCLCASTIVQGRHWTAVKHLLYYIKGTLDYKLHYGPCPHPAAFASFSDADFAGDINSAKSTTGFVLFMVGAVS